VERYVIEGKIAGAVAIVGIGHGLEETSIVPIDGAGCKAFEGAIIGDGPVIRAGKGLDECVVITLGFAVRGRNEAVDGFEPLLGVVGSTIEGDVMFVNDFAGANPGV
jgi:hypothetical protein